MIDTGTLERFGNFLRGFHVSETLIKKLIDSATRQNGLPRPENLRNRLNAIGSGVTSPSALTIIINDYTRLFSPSTYHIPKRKLLPNERVARFEIDMMEKENERIQRAWEHRKKIREEQEKIRLKILDLATQQKKKSGDK